MKNSAGLGFELVGGSESKERGYDSEKVTVSKETRRKLGHFAAQGAIFKSDLVY
ncbi:hypothetical protein IKE88_02545 [Candidatus Saccharibacteria bacterium]|nr:hypothetical protein [Candidatus Saccharibacteria bacterium]